MGLTSHESIATSVMSPIGFGPVCAGDSKYSSVAALSSSTNQRRRQREIALAPLLTSQPVRACALGAREVGASTGGAACAAPPARSMTDSRFVRCGCRHGGSM